MVVYITDTRLDKYTGSKRFKLQSLSDHSSALGNEQYSTSQAEFLAVINSAVAKSTWAKYSSGFNAFCSFERFTGKSYSWPLSLEVWRAFILWLHHHRHLAPNSIQTYLSAVKFVHTLRGFSSSHLSEDCLSKLLMRGIEHSSTNFLDHPNTRRVVTLPLLITLGNRIAATSWPALDKQVIWAAATTGFFGTIRMGEILSSEEKSFSPASDLLWKDVRCSSPNSLLIHLKQPKSGMPGGEKVDLFEFPGYGCCPVRALKNLREKQIQAGNTDESLPVFRFSSGKNLTCAIMNKTLASLLSDLCIPGEDSITCHSFRAGIPSILSMFPDLVSSDQIKGWGRWQSDCYQLYTRLSLLEKEQIFGKIKQALYASADFDIRND
jgi:hypothetical protein